MSPGSAKHVPGNGGVPAERLLIGRLAQLRAFPGLGNEAVGLGDLLVGRFVGGTDLDAVIGADERPARVGSSAVGTPWIR